jgi:hypothetical protein
MDTVYPLAQWLGFSLNKSDLTTGATKYLICHQQRLRDYGIYLLC